MRAGDARYVEVRLKRIDLERGGRPVLRAVDWSVRPGERWVLAGGNGSGKTQLLKLVAGAVWPTPTGRESRRYVWRGESWPTPADVSEEIAYVGPERQDRYERYGWNHTVSQIVGTGLYRTDIPLNPLTPADRKRITSLLQRLGIAHLGGVHGKPGPQPGRRRGTKGKPAEVSVPAADRGFLTLSYGERRLTLLARALASEPKLLLLDELLNGLDETNRARALHWLESTARSRLPWVLATHRAEDVPSCATHALILDGGRIVYRGSIRRAPLEKWLDHAPAAGSSSRGGSRRPRVVASKGPSASAAAASVRERNRLSEGVRRGLGREPRHPGSSRGAKPIVRLSRASVYLDDHQALDDISFEVHAGECWVIHGSNGSGKTTLLRTLYGDYGVAAGGRIERAGIEPGVPLQEFKRRAGFVAAHLQADHPHHLTVDEIVQSGRHASIGLNDPPTAADRAAARRALEFFGLGGFGPRERVELSYGQMRRVLFARAWVTHPKLLLLDEPLGGIDAPTRTVLLERIGRLVAQGTAVVMTTHHRDEWPPYATHELELSAGRMRYAGHMRGPASAARPTGTLASEKSGVSGRGGVSKVSRRAAGARS